MSAKGSIENSDQPLLDALRKLQVVASVMHLDHYSVKGGVAIDTDFIILIRHQPQTEEEVLFEPFMVSKTYHEFRNFASELDKAVIQAKKGTPSSPSEEVQKLMQYCALVVNLIDSSKAQYLGKLSSAVVKQLAKQRRQIINSVLEATCQNYPTSNNSKLAEDVAKTVVTFFLTDVCSVEERQSFYNKEQEYLKKIVQRQNSRTHNFFGKILDVAFKDDKAAKTPGKPEPVERALSATATMTTQTPTTMPGFSRASSVPIVPTSGTKFATNNPKVAPVLATSAEEESEPAGEARNSRRSVVVPLSRRDRRSAETRELDKIDLNHNKNKMVFVLHDSFVKISSTAREGGTSIIQNLVDGKVSPIFLFAFIATCMAILTRIASVKIQVDADWGLLLMFGAYCLGMHTPRSGTTAEVAPSPPKRRRASPDRSERLLLKRSMLSQARLMESRKLLFDERRTGKGFSSVTAPSPFPEFVEQAAPTLDEKALESHAIVMTTPELIEEEEEEDDDESGGYPMSVFPEGAELGSVTNCWGVSNHEDFKVRGPNYLKDKKKVLSKDFLFPIRGVELLLTDACPANVGQNPRIFEGKLRDRPTFIINFRLPWGVLLIYYDIPEMFIPYLKACYEQDAVDKTKLEQSLGQMTPGERCLCRFLMMDDAQKNKTLKLVPVVVKGPWVVKQVVDGKPALIGKALPLEYVYQPAEGNKALYWEVDLDIAASSAARTILSVVRSYTSVLTTDLGFVVQGNTEDELPEQMLGGVRLHGVDPLTAPSYPQMVLTPALMNVTSLDDSEHPVSPPRN